MLAILSCREGDRSREKSAPIADEPFTNDEIATIETLSPLPEPPEDPTNRVSGDADAAHLGRFLFFDERLSANGEVSCASCHRPNHGFSVPTRLGEGIGSTRRHPPSLLNVAHHSWFDWDGKADSLWSQALRPLENPDEQGTTRVAVAKTVGAHDGLRRAYRAVFGELPDLSSDERYPPAARPRPDAAESEAHQKWTSMEDGDRERVNRIFSNVAKAIAAYERRLTSGDAPFDRYVEGLESGDGQKLEALSPRAKRGLELFVDEARCINCHNGPNFTDGTFHNLGLEPRPWLDRRDLGRWRGVPRVKSFVFNATGPYSDRTDGRDGDAIRFLRRTAEARGQFKTPSLRNVARTPPYMHGGHFETLEEVVRFYSTLHEQPNVGHREEMLEPLGLTDAQIDDLVAFLRSLSGARPDSRLLRPPDSPVPPTGEERDADRGP